MKIWAVVPGFSRTLDDASIPALRELLLAWARAGDEVEVLALRHPPGPASYEVGPLRVRTLAGGATSGIARPTLLWRALDALTRAPQGRPDVIVGFWADEPGWVAVEAAKRLRVPALVALMGGELAAIHALGYGVGTELLGRWLRDQALARADAVTVGSAWLGERAAPHLEALKAMAQQPLVLPLGLDLLRFAPVAAGGSGRDGAGRDGAGAGDPITDTAAPAPDAAPALVIGVLGNLVPIKNHAPLVRTVARLRNAGLDVRLDIAGDGPEHAALLALGASLGVEQAMQLRGALPWADVPGWLRGLDLHVLPSKWESQGMATLEAAACGVAVAGSAVGSLATFAASAGRWPADDDAEMTRQLRAIATRHRDDRGWLAGVAAQARAEVTATVAADMAAQSWRAALASLVERGRRC